MKGRIRICMDLGGNFALAWEDVNSVAQAVRRFAATLDETHSLNAGRDCSAVIYSMEGDMEAPFMALEIGPRGGIRRVQL